MQVYDYDVPVHIIHTYTWYLSSAAVNSCSVCYRQKHSSDSTARRLQKRCKKPFRKKKKMLELLSRMSKSSLYHKIHTISEYQVRSTVCSDQAGCFCYQRKRHHALHTAYARAPKLGRQYTSNFFPTQRGQSCDEQPFSSIILVSYLSEISAI